MPITKRAACPSEIRPLSFMVNDDFDVRPCNAAPLLTCNKQLRSEMLETIEHRGELCSTLAYLTFRGLANGAPEKDWRSKRPYMVVDLQWQILPTPLRNIRYLCLDVQILENASWKNRGWSANIWYYLFDRLARFLCFGPAFAWSPADRPYRLMNYNGARECPSRKTPLSKLSIIVDPIAEEPTLSGIEELMTPESFFEEFTTEFSRAISLPEWHEKFINNIKLVELKCGYLTYSWDLVKIKALHKWVKVRNPLTNSYFWKMIRHDGEWTNWPWDRGDDL